MIKQAFLPALFGILFYKILEAPMHTYPYIAEIAGALGGCFMVWFCDRMSFFLRKKKI
ncbi:hypothetical protein [Acetobacter orleanensis]|uniref:hypothetical protein n=1 Tax=Acetobacter orleanensis TaxID=104099 RepID=UPI000A75E23F|nr:hypothetical protein [Acetobacter orleanensis]